MITLELTQVDNLTGRDADKVFLVGDKFTVTTCDMKWGEIERTITIITCPNHTLYVAESYQDVKDHILAMIRSAR